MIRPFVRLFGCLVLLLASSVASAGSYTLHSDGYYYDSYGHAFVRVQTYHAGACGSCGYYSYAYNSVPQAAYVAPYVAPTPPAYSANWQTEGLRFMTNRDTFILKERAAALDYANYKEFITTIVGPQGLQIQGYGPNVAYGTPTFAQQQFFAAQGNTVYGGAGYQFHNSVASYGQDVDVNAAIQAFARTVQGAQSLAGTVAGDQGAILDRIIADKLKAIEAQARVAEINAKGQAFAALSRSLEERKVVVTQSGSGTAIGQVPAASPPNAPPVKTGGSLPQLEALMVAKCAMCHSGKRTEGNLDLTLWNSFDRKRKGEIWERTVSQDPNKSMPRVEGGGQGPRLTPEETRLFLEN